LIAAVHSSTGNDEAAAVITAISSIFFGLTFAMVKYNMTPPQLVAAIFRRLIRG